MHIQIQQGSIIPLTLASLATMLVTQTSNFPIWLMSSSTHSAYPLVPWTPGSNIIRIGNLCRLADLIKLVPILLELATSVVSGIPPCTLTD